MAKEKKEKRGFNWFNRYNLDGKGVDKDEPKILENPGVANFFKFYWRKLSQLLSVNLLMVFGNFPIFFYFIYKAGYFGVESSAPYYQAFAPLYGAEMMKNSPVTSALYGIFGIQVPISANTGTTLIFLGLTALLFFTFGPVNVGITYLCRNMLKEEPVFMMQDFFYAIKKNFKQGLLLGILDLAALLLLGYDISYFFNNLTSTSMYIMFYMSILMFIIFFMMRFYMYHILITFDLSIFKILKNSLIFSLLGIKRNLMGLLGFLIVLAFNYFMFGLYIPIGVVLPFIIVPATLMLIETYVAYPKIKEYMIDPYYSDDEDFSESDDAEAAGEGSAE